MYFFNDKTSFFTFNNNESELVFWTFTLPKTGQFNGSCDSLNTFLFFKRVNVLQIILIMKLKAFSVTIKHYIAGHHIAILRIRRGREGVVVGFTATYAISTYHNWCCDFESWSGRGAQHYVVKFVSDLRQVGGFLRVPPPRGSSTNKTDCHDRTEILLKVALNTIKQTNNIAILEAKSVYTPDHMP